MKNHIKVFIKDDMGLGDALLKEGCSQAWIDEAKQIIQRRKGTSSTTMSKSLAMWMR